MITISIVVENEDGQNMVHQKQVIAMQGEYTRLEYIVN